MSPLFRLIGRSDVPMSLKRLRLKLYAFKFIYQLIKRWPIKDFVQL
ncbi:Uncharacterised protein [Serratia plymuthica]|nr:Uncharacterised protein [Serratia plymuthica]VEI20159.1 Uncharacterised protein [Serratia plymuthica]